MKRFFLIILIGILFLNSCQENIRGINTTENTSQDNQCTKDTDCALVSVDCCGCNSGGSMKSIPLREKIIYDAMTEKKCESTMCLQVISDDPSCQKQARCIQGSCGLE